MLFTAKKVSVFLVVNQMEISQDFFFFFHLILKYWKMNTGTIELGEYYEKYINTQTVHWLWIKD